MDKDILERALTSSPTTSLDEILIINCAFISAKCQQNKQNEGKINNSIDYMPQTPLHPTSPLPKGHTPAEKPRKGIRDRANGK